MNLNIFWIRLVDWWNENIDERWFDLTTKISMWFFIRRQKRRAKNPELVELDAFRGLIDLEKRLKDWPNAIPLLEQALQLYDITHQTGKRESIRKRLEAVDPTNPKVHEYFEVEKQQTRRSASQKLIYMTDNEKRALDQARALVKETGRCSTAMLQRRMGIGYNHAAELVSIIHAEEATK